MKTLTGNHTYIYDGASVKSLDPWDVDDNTGWTLLGGDNDTNDMRKVSAVLYRCFELRAGAVSRMPFEIVRGETVVDTSAEWANKLGWMSNPSKFLYLTESAMIAFGAAYWLRISSVAAVKELKYFLPQSVTPVIDEKAGLTGFKRAVGAVTIDYKPEELLYFWPSDPSVELGPAKAYPMTAAAHACGVLVSVDEFAQAFFERGAIKATILAVKGNPVEAERQRLTAWWNKMFSGIKNAFSTHVMNADQVTATQIGEGLEGIQNTTLTQDAAQAIAVAFGIPFSILFSNAANYATSQQDWSNFYQTTIEPECNVIASILNEQLLEPMGLHINFLPETLDIYQEDEASRSQALTAYVNAGTPLLMAMDLLGVELTDEQRAELVKAEAEKKKAAEELAAQLQKKPEEDKETEADEKPEPETGNVQDELAKWERKSLNALKRGKSANVDFESDCIPTEMVGNIIAQLGDAKCAEDVRDAFRLPMIPRAEKVDAAMNYLDLLAELRRANDLLEAGTNG